MLRRRLLACSVLLSALVGLSCGSSTSTSVTAPTTPRCQVTATASQSSFAAAGGTGNVAVTTTRDCTWSATTGVSWLTLGGSPSGQGSGSFDFTVAGNSDVAARSAAIDVNGQKVTISEQPAPCQYSLSPAALSIPSAGAVVNVSLQTQASCAWTAVSNDSWISVRSTSGTGAATVQLTIATNTDALRTGSVTIGGQTVTVSQANGTTLPPPPTPTPTPPNCSYSIAPTTQSFSATGGTGSVTLATTAGCPWTATSNAPWVAITSATSGAGGAVVVYQVAANPGGARSGTLTIAGQTFTVTEAAAPAPPPPPPACSYSVSPGSQRIGPGGGQVTFNVSAGSGCAWTATVNDAWLVIASGASGTGNGSVVVDAQANSGGGRTGTVTIAGQTVNVRQSGADATLSGPVAALSGTCPTLQFLVSSARVLTDSSTTFKKGSCKNVDDGVAVTVQGTVQSDLAVLATELTLLTKE